MRAPVADFLALDEALKDAEVCDTYGGELDAVYVCGERSKGRLTLDGEFSVAELAKLVVWASPNG